MAMTQQTLPVRSGASRQNGTRASPRPVLAPSRLGLVAAATVALLQFLFMVRLIEPGLVSSYPNIEFDGFDWVLEGLYLRALAAGIAGPPLLFLRSPVFVLVTALDAFAGSSGIVVVGALCLAHFLSLTTLLVIWRRLGVSGGTQAALFAVAVLSPYAYFRGYILADPLAIAGLLVSARLMLEWFSLGDEGKFRAAGAVGLLAGLTQLYGLLPFLAGAALTWGHDRRSGRRGWSRVFFTTAVVGLGGLVLLAWNAAIPHERVPVQFELLRPSLAMAGFYANIWVWYFGFLAPVGVVLAVAAMRRHRRSFRLATGYLTAVTLLFVGLLFCYQSEEARFSWYYFPLVLCLVAAGLAWLERVGWGRRGRSALAVGLVLLLVQALAVTPGDFWQPKVRDIQFDPGETWVALLLRARVVDRLDLTGACGAPGRFCQQARIPADVDVEERRLLGDYVRLRTNQGLDGVWGDLF